jgi:hypothetical protein
LDSPEDRERACEVISIETMPARANSKIYILRAVVRTSQGELIQVQALIGIHMAADPAGLEQWVRSFVSGSNPRQT